MNNLKLFKNVEMDEIKTGDIGSYEGREYVCRSLGTTLSLYSNFDDLLYKRNKIKAISRLKVVKVSDMGVTMPAWWERLMEEDNPLRYIEDV